MSDAYADIADRNAEMWDSMGGAAEAGSVLGVFHCFVSAFFSSLSALRGYRVKCSVP